MVILQNVCKNCVRILKEEKHRQLRMFVILWKEWKELASSSCQPKREKPKIVRTPKNIAAVPESVYEAPSTSIQFRRHKDLGMTPNKVQLVRELKPIDHPMRFRFAKWTCDRLIEDADFGRSNEVHFDLGGYVNKQNCRIWGAENSHAYIEKPTYPNRVTVWCGFWSRGIIEPFFFSQWRSLSSHVERIFVH